MLRQVLVLSAVVLLARPAAAQVTVRGDSLSAGRDARSRDGWLGMGLSCSRCSYQSRDGGGGRWEFSEAPSVFSVDPDGPADRAGLRPGDTLVSIDGKSLTSREGGAAFGGVRPGQQVSIRYRRDGRERDVRLTAIARPLRGETREFAEQLRAISEARERAAERAQRQMEAAQRQMEMSRRQAEEAQRQAQAQLQHLAQVSAELASARSRGELGDSARLERLQRQLDSASAALGAAESAWAHLPPSPPSLPALAPAAPAAPAPPAMPATALPSLAPVAPIPPAVWGREAGPVRYSGRLGNVIVEARGAGEVTTTEVSDSEVVVTSRDMSVRIVIRPREARPPRAVRPAAPAAPARPARD